MSTSTLLLLKRQGRVFGSFLKLSNRWMDGLAAKAGLVYEQFYTVALEATRQSVWRFLEVKQ